jgi:hypothetical protein
VEGSSRRVLLNQEIKTAINMKKTLCLTLLSALAVNVASAQFVINNSPGLFDPSFRGQPNTTWFGWGPGSFEGSTQNELIDNPAPSIGTTSLGISLTQNPANDILASSDNIYTGAALATDLLLQLPTSGSVGSGFTTIIVQGRTAFGGYDTPPGFQPILGINPIFEVGPNANGSGQFWAKYELPGNSTVYDLTIRLDSASFISIAELEFDTYWSPTGFSTDFAVVPEPSALALLGMGLTAGFLRLRSR